MPEKMILNLFFPIISKYLSFYSSIPKNEEEKSTMTCGQSKKISKYMAKDYFILMSNNSIWCSFTPCVDGVTAAAAADFPGLANRLPAAGQ